MASPIAEDSDLGVLISAPSKSTSPAQPISSSGKRQRPNSTVDTTYLTASTTGTVKVSIEDQASPPPYPLILSAEGMTLQAAIKPDKGTSTSHNNISELSGQAADLNIKETDKDKTIASFEVNPAATKIITIASSDFAPDTVIVNGVKYVKEKLSTTIPQKPSMLSSVQITQNNSSVQSSHITGLSTAGSGQTNIQSGLGNLTTPASRPTIVKAHFDSDSDDDLTFPHVPSPETVISMPGGEGDWERGPCLRLVLCTQDCLRQADISKWRERDRVVASNPSWSSYS